LLLYPPPPLYTRTYTHTRKERETDLAEFALCLVFDFLFVLFHTELFDSCSGVMWPSYSLVQCSGVMWPSYSLVQCSGVMWPSYSLVQCSGVMWSSDRE